MFIVYYELENNEPYFNIYYKNKASIKAWEEEKKGYIYNIEELDLKISGNNYQEKKASLEELAKNWQNNFSSLSWAYSELEEITNYFYKNGKKYGLLKEFKNNGII